MNKFMVHPGFFFKWNNYSVNGSHSLGFFPVHHQQHDDDDYHFDDLNDLDCKTEKKSNDNNMKWKRAETLHVKGKKNVSKKV